MFGLVYGEGYISSSNELMVYYKKLYYWKIKNEIGEKWENERLDFNKLTFNEKEMMCSYYDREKIRKQLYVNNPLLLLNHINHIRLDTDRDLVKKLKYYKNHYFWDRDDHKFLGLIDAIFSREYKCWIDGKYYDIFLFLIKNDHVETLTFLLDYGLRRKVKYKPKIEEDDYYLLREKNINSIQKELSYYYFNDENKISNFTIE